MNGIEDCYFRRGFSLLAGLSVLAACGLNPLQGPMMFCGDESYFLVSRHDGKITVYKERTLQSERQTMARAVDISRVQENAVLGLPSSEVPLVAINFFHEGVETTLFVDEGSVAGTSENTVLGRFAARQVGGVGQPIERCNPGFQTY